MARFAEEVHSLLPLLPHSPGWREKRADAAQPTSASRALPFLYTLLALSLFTTATLASLVYGQAPPPPRVPVPITRVLLRTTEDNGAGMGAVIKQQMQRSVVLAGVLGAQVYVVESSYAVWKGLHGGRGHAYDSIGIINAKRHGQMLAQVDFSRMCKLSTYMNQEVYMRLTATACEGPEHLTLQHRELISNMDGCTVILHDLPWETSPSMTKCTWKWLSNAFGNPAPRRVEGKTSVGLHIRWGDLADNNFPGDSRTDDRSIPIPTANSVLASLEGCIGALDVRVYMEDHNNTVLADLEHDFDLVDTDDDLGDLLNLQANEILIVAGSGYTTTAHQLSRGGLTVVPDWEGHQQRFWEKVGTNSVMKWGAMHEEQRDCDLIRQKFKAGMERSRAMLEGFAAVTVGPERRSLPRVAASVES